ncbi:MULTISPECIES: hypothetical protein [unclassified Polaribacter]|nr:MULTISPECIES: hypothetical protein [unclassified Polaribacter]
MAEKRKTVNDNRWTKDDGRCSMVVVRCSMFVVGFTIDDNQKTMYEKR